jgi:hypothetical protein
LQIKNVNDIILRGKYDFAEPLVNVSSSMQTPLSVALNLPITSKVTESEELVLTINMYGYVSKEGSGDNTVLLVHARGETDSYVVLPLIVPGDDSRAAAASVFVDYDNRDVKNYEAVIDEEGAGTVHILNIKSASSDFGISIQIDDNNELRRSYSDLHSDTDELCDISAYLHDGYYIISVSDLKFKHRIKVGPYNTEGGSMTYAKIQGKFEVV